ncbi:MAG: hypothetical protein K8R54_06550 [Bacteroidales bacterium]|nr:hypothetical protein [Bacteroidales bacterium]
MKKLVVFIVLILISGNIYSQNYEQRLDSLEFEIKKLEKKQTNIINQIDLHQKRYKKGQYLSMAGLGISIVTCYLYVKNDNERILLSGGLISSVFIISGFFISLDSFNYLKKEFDYSDYSKMWDVSTTTSSYDRYR